MTKQEGDASSNSGNSGDHDGAARARHAGPTITIASTVLMNGAREVTILHAGEHYRLRVTADNKLILTKSIYKSDLSNMLSVSTKIPESIIDAIGPAPGIGRRAWLDLVGLLTEEGRAAAIHRVIADPAFSALENDARSKQVVAAAKPQPMRAKAESWSRTDGETLAKVIHEEDRVSSTIDRRRSPDFAEFMLTRLRDLYAEFKAGA